MNFPKVTIENIPKEIQKWIGAIIDPVNTLVSNVKACLEKGLTVSDNMRGDIKTVEVINNFAAFPYAGKTVPKVILVGGYLDVTVDSWTPTAGIFCTFIYGKNQDLNVTFYGLNSAHKYKVNLLILEN
jgi:hypothetical protein